MGLFNKKSKHEIEIEREISYGKAKSVVNNYIDENVDLKDLQSECSCPYGINCKHGVAVLLQYMGRIQRRR